MLRIELGQSFLKLAAVILTLVGVSGCLSNGGSKAGSTSPIAQASGGSDGGFDGKVYAIYGPCANGSVGSLLKIKVDRANQLAEKIEENCQSVPVRSNIFNVLDVSNSISILFYPSNTALQEANAPLNEILMTNTTNISAAVGVPFSLNIRMNAAPMGIEGYQICLFMVDASNHVPYAHNCFWPALRSDMASGFEEFLVQPTLPAGSTPGRYLITASYVRFNGVKYQAVPMNKGAGVTSSPEVGAPFAYVIGEADFR